MDGEGGCLPTLLFVDQSGIEMNYHIANQATNGAALTQLTSAVSSAG